MENISGVLVFYNPEDWMIKNALKLSLFVDKLIIVDNSNFKNLDKKNLDERIEYYWLEENQGLAYALNFSFKKLLHYGYKWCIYFDQDTIVDDKLNENYLSKINELNSNVAILSPQYIIDRKKKPIIENKFVNITFAMTSCSIYNLEITNKIGFFDERYFLDSVDLEYCMRCLKNNYSILRFCGYAIEHNPGITKKTKILKYKYGYMSPVRAYYQKRNIMLLIETYPEHKFRFKKNIFLKWLKIILFFDNKREFLRMWKKAKTDYRNRKFGKIDI